MLANRPSGSFLWNTHSVDPTQHLTQYSMVIKAIRATLEPFFISGKLYRMDCLRGKVFWSPMTNPDDKYKGTMKSLRFPAYGQGPFDRVNVPHKGILMFVDFIEATFSEGSRTHGVGVAPVHLKFLYSGGDQGSRFISYSIHSGPQAATFRQWFTAIENIPAYKAQKESEKKIGYHYQEIIQKRQEGLKVSKAEHMKDVQKAYSKWQKALSRGDAKMADWWKTMHQEFLEKGKKDLL